MSNWYYVAVAYGVTYLTLAAYAIYLVRRRARAAHALEAELHRQEE